MVYRYERKYFLSSHTAEILKRRIAGVLSPDSHSGGRYIVHNIYFDDVYNSFYYDKLSGSMTRDKYRARYYNGDLSYIRLEHKRKESELSFKRHAAITKEQLLMLSHGEMDFISQLSDPLFKAFANINRTRSLRPTAAFTYLREAYVHDTGNVRVTFDSQIAEDIPGLCGVLEVKYSNFLPDFISGLLSSVPLTQTEMSKYYMVMDWNRRVKPYDKTTGAFNYRAGDYELKRGKCNADNDGSVNLCAYNLPDIPLFQ